MKPIRFVCMLVAILVVSCGAVLAQPGGPPQWLQDLNPADYVLLVKDIKPPFKYGTDPEAQAEAKGTNITVGGKTQTVTSFYMATSQTVNCEYANTARTTPPTPMRWKLPYRLQVLVCENEAAAKASIQAYYLGWLGGAADVNGLNDPRLARGIGASAASGRIIRYRNLIMMITPETNSEIKTNRPKMPADLWNSADNDAMAVQQDRIKQLALMWLNKVAGPEPPDLHVEAGNVLLAWWGGPHPRVTREKAADQQGIAVQVDNRSATVQATDVHIQISVQKHGESKYKPICPPLSVGNIAAGRSRTASVVWDLKGENVEGASLQVRAYGREKNDIAPADNTCAFPVSIYFAKQGPRAYSLEQDTYSFKNWGWQGGAVEEVVEGVLANIVGNIEADGQMLAIMQRLAFPQLYMRLFDYLGRSATAGGGHCYGIAATSALYYEDPSLKPVPKRTYDMEREEASPNINIYHRTQMLPMVQAVLEGKPYYDRNWGAANCLAGLRTSLRDQRRPAMVEFGAYDLVQEEVEVNGVKQMQPVEKYWQHAVLAYKLIEIPGRDAAVFIYDSSWPYKPPLIPPQPMPAIWLSATNWGFTDEFAARYPRIYSNRIAANPIRREISLTAVNAIIPQLKKQILDMVAFFEKGNKFMALLRCPADVLFTDAQGRRTGSVAGKPINEIPGAEIRTQGEVEIYILPADEQYSVSITGNAVGEADLDIIRAESATEAGLISFQDIPTNQGGTATAKLLPGGQMDGIIAGGRTIAPAIVATFDGDRATWKTPQPVTPQPVTPQPVTPQPVTPQPGVGSAPGWGAGRIGTEIDAGKLMGEADTFTGVSKLVAIFPYKEVPAGTTVVASWLRDGHQLQQQEYQVKVTTGQVWFWISTKRKGGYEPGAYEVRVQVGDKVVASRAFRVGTAGTPQPGTTGGNPFLQKECEINLSQLGLCALIYSQRHDGKLPDADKWVDQLWPYLKEQAFFKCPSAPDLEYGYAMNAVLSGVKVEELESAAEMVLFFDSHLGTRNAAGGRDAVCNPGRHGGGNCYVYADGHAKWLAQIPDLNPAGLTPKPAGTVGTPQPTTPQPAGNVLTDGDVLKTLTGNEWTRLDPGGDGEWTDDEAPKAITIGAPPGNHLHRDYNYDAPRQTVKVNGDFTMQAFVKTNPQWGTQAAGLWVFGPQRSLVRLERVCAGDRQLVALAAYDTAGQRLGLHTADCTAKELRLCIRRTADDFHAWYRLTGADDWTLIGKVSVPMPVRSRAGLGVINDPGSEWFEARFAGFQIKVGANAPAQPADVAIPGAKTPGKPAAKACWALTNLEARLNEYDGTPAHWAGAKRAGPNELKVAAMWGRAVWKNGNFVFDPVFQLIEARFEWSPLPARLYPGDEVTFWVSGQRTGGFTDLSRRTKVGDRVGRCQSDLSMSCVWGEGPRDRDDIASCFVSPENPKARSPGLHGVPLHLDGRRSIRYHLYGTHVGAMIYTYTWDPTGNSIQPMSAQ